MKPKSLVAELIAARIAASGQLQKDIALQCGFDTPNMITMVKQGLTHLPMDRIGPMAKALGIDPVQLFKMCMAEYYPATWRSLAPLMATALTKPELRLINTVRRSSKGPLPSKLSSVSKSHLENFIASLASPATSS